MHILEQYSLNCGLKIDKPYILDAFFPMIYEKYVTFHAAGKFPSRLYDYTQEVIDLIHPYLRKNNIEIVQVGAQNEPFFSKCARTNGQTNFNQLAYLIKSSMLHFGVDSLPIHLASMYDIKMVGLYCNMYKEQSKPYWGNKDNQILIESHRNNKKPSYAAQEIPKTINLINPEEIAISILNLLNIKHSIKRKSEYFGENYSMGKAIEVVPDHYPDLEKFGAQMANVRMDLKFDENVLSYILSKYKSIIVTNKAFDINRILTLKQNIVKVVYNFEKNEQLDLEFIKDLKKNGIEFLLIAQFSEQDAEKYKYETMEYCNIFNKDLNILKDKSEPFKDKKLKFKSNKFILSNGKVFPTVYHFKNNIPFVNDLDESFDFIHNEDIYTDFQHLYLFQD
jgi:hypothetical protein